MLRPVQTPNTVDADVFPPLRAQTTEQSIFLPYVTEDIAFEEEYEEYLRWSETSDTNAQGSSAWSRLPELVHDLADNISDSESIVSIGELGEDARLDTAKETRDVPDENVNNWEVSVFGWTRARPSDMDCVTDDLFGTLQHMSPKTMAALTKSPAHGRRSSSGSGQNLRQVNADFTLDAVTGSAIDDTEEDEQYGPMPKDSSSPFQPGGSVDEVEYAYG